MGKGKKGKSKPQPKVVDEGIIYPADQITLKIENSSSYGLNIENNLLFNTYVSTQTVL